MRIEKEHITVGIHTAPNHADDILCVAFLCMEYGKENVTVIKSRDIEILEKCDYVLDVGGKDEIVKDENGNILQVWLDHHQKEAGYNENGIKKSACGKLADFLYGENPFICKELHRVLLDAVEATDNGQDLNKFQIDENLLSFVGYTASVPWYIDKEQENYAELIDKKFFETLNMILNVLDNVFEDIKGLSIAEPIINRAIETRTNKEYIVLEKYIPTHIWQYFVHLYNETAVKFKDKIKFVIYPTKNCWDAQTVHVNLHTFTPYVGFPFFWGGLRFEDLEKECGIKGAIFCHTEQFFFEGETLECVEKAVKKALKK